MKLRSISRPAVVAAVGAIILVGSPIAASAAPISGSSHSSGPQTASGLHSRTVTTQNETSSNWGGQVSHDAKFSSVKASWTVPKLSCPSTGFQSSYLWIGLGGWRDDKALEQVGSAQWCDKGTAHYGLFAEFWQDGPIAGDGGEYPNYPVKPGDKLDATVSKLSNGKYRLNEVSSRGWTYTKDGNAPGNYAGNLTAEVIAEPPYRKAYGEPLANFGTVNFSNIEIKSDVASTPDLYDVQYNNVKKTEASKSGSSALRVKWLHY